MSKIFDEFVLGTGEEGVQGYNVSLYYEDTAGIQLIVSGRKTADGGIEEIDEENKVRINADRGFSITYDSKTKKIKLEEVKDENDDFDNDGFREYYEVNSIKVGAGDAFDAKISLNCSLLGDGVVAIIGANDGRDYTDKNASMLAASLDSTPTYFFYGGKRLFIHMHRSRARYFQNSAFSKTGVPRWGKDFSVQHE